MTEAPLKVIGTWLDINKEAIYGTRRWLHFREGRDIRFTRSKEGKYVYAIALKWPGKSLSLRTVRPQSESKITMLGSDTRLAWRLDAKALIIDIPASLQHKRPCDNSWVFKIEVSPTARTKTNSTKARDQLPLAG
jgi:alpha-L-fucosidase